MALTAEELKAIREQSVPFSPKSPTTPAPEGQSVEGLGPTMYPSSEEVLGAIGLGTLQGAAKGTAITGGAMSGLRKGVEVSGRLPPGTSPIVRAIPPVAGTVAGAAAGMLGAEALDALLFDELAALQRPDVAPYREGGKTFGETIAAAPQLFRIPLMTGNRVSRFISDVGEMARAAPKTFLVGETVAAVPAGIAGGTVYNYDPEAKWTRAGAEVTASLLTPTRMVGQAVTASRDFLRDQFSAATAQGRQITAENAAARQLQQILADHGEDIPRLVRLLERPLPGGVPSPTAAQKTGSLLLSEVERALGNMHVKFAADTQAQGKEALRAYALLAERMREVGTPEALTQAAQLRSVLFDEMLNARLATADANAAAKVVRIKRDTPQARAEIGEIIKSETSMALQNARDVEKMLWDDALKQVTAPVKTTVKVPQRISGHFLSEEVRRILGPEETRRAAETGIIPKTVTKMEVPVLAASSTYEAFLKRASEIGDAAFERVVPAVVRDIMQDLGATKATVLAYKNAKNQPAARETGDVMSQMPGSYKPKEVSVSELINYRSNLLGLARDAAARGEASEASLYGNLAEAMLDDLGKLKSPAFDAARDYSRALNDTFTRTFAKTATYQADVARTGAERLPAEILVNRAFGRNADVTAQRMLEIEDAVKFMRTRYDDAVAKFGPKSEQARMLKPLADMADQSVISVQDAQTRVLRLMAAQAVDPVSGRVNPRQLQNFVNENKTMLDKVGLTTDLTDAVKAEMALRQVAKENSVLNKTLRQQTAFAQVLKGGENPTAAVADVLNSRSPVLGMNRLMQLAEAGGPAAVGGLRASLMDYAFTKAGGLDNFDPAAFRSALFAPLGPNKPSIINLMRQHGMIDFGGMRAINEIVRPMLRIEDAIANKQSVDAVVEGGGAVTDLALRIIGSKLGASVAGHQGPGTLVAAAAGSKAMRQVFDKMPAGMTRATIEEAMKDPQLLALLLKKPTSAQQQSTIARDIVTRLVSSGAVPAAMINLVEVEPRETAGQGPVGMATRERRQAAPPTKGVPLIAPVAPPASGPGNAPSPAGKVGMGPEQRQMYEALFPQDTINSLMAMQPAQG